MTYKEAVRIAVQVMESQKDECWHMSRISVDPDTLASLAEEIDKCTQAIARLMDGDDE